jgi:hypothetical protein
LDRLNFLIIQDIFTLVASNIYELEHSFY